MDQNANLFITRPTRQVEATKKVTQLANIKGRQFGYLVMAYRLRKCQPAFKGLDKNFTLGLLTRPMHIPVTDHD